MESELFGHVKGAFTGAATAKIGLIESANGGTALFDEIGELPLDVQSKLLRVLQEKEFRPVGSVSARGARISGSSRRPIATWRRKWKRERSGAIFIFRLNVINMRLAPLRERREDIPALINHFLSRVGGNYSVTAEAMEVLLTYDWPGNVRELENCIQHMVAINSGPLLHVADLPSNLQNFMLQKKVAVPDRGRDAFPRPLRKRASPETAVVTPAVRVREFRRDPAGRTGTACDHERARIHQRGSRGGRASVWESDGRRCIGS